MTIIIFQRRKMKVDSAKEERDFPTFSVNGPPSHTLLPLLPNPLFEISTSINLIEGISLLTKSRGTSPVVQRLRLHPPNTGGLNLIPGQRARFHMPQLKDLTYHK